MVTQQWIDPALEGYSWDHSLSLEHAYFVHLPIMIVNSPLNLRLLEKHNNLRKGNRSYSDVVSLIEQYNSWSDKDKWEAWCKELEEKWEIEFKSLSGVIYV